MRRARGRASVAAVAAALVLLLAPLAGVALHEDHDGPICPVCKLAAQPLIGLPAGTAIQPPVPQPVVAEDAAAAPSRDALHGDRPSRAPPV